MPRVRFEFCKGDQVRFLSHLDLMKTMEKAIRRAEIPIAFSEGFNPHPKMNFASPLAVGVTSDGEYMDIETAGEVDLQELLKKFLPALPKGIEIKCGRFVSDNAPSLMSEVNRADYEITAPLSSPINTNDLDRHLAAFLIKEEISVTKKTKKGLRPKNIRPGIKALNGTVKEDQINFKLTVVISNEGNVRPEEVVCSFRESSELPFDCDALYIRRTSLYTEREGLQVSPMD